MILEDFIKDCYENAKAHGFHDVPRSFGEEIALMHSEASEALEEYRNGIFQINEIGYENSFKPIGIPIELADLIIRVFDTCGVHNIDIVNALEVKMKYNKTRPYRHGDKRL